MSAAPPTQTEAHFEPPDILVIRSGGATSVDSVKRIVELIREHGEKGGVMVLADITHTAGMPGDARAYISQNLKPEWVLSAAIVGASFPMKVAVKAMALGSYLIGKKTYELAFADTVEEARAALAQHRAGRAASAGG
jgi:hypothetical protein